MRYVRPFDPWKSELCTCPEKYSFNPYTGCEHRCIYCYATYIPNFFRVRTKKDLFKYLRKDLDSLPEGVLVSMSNSSDPYPPVERELEITRRCLELMREYEIRLLVVTKSDLVVRDMDLLSDMRCAVSITVTSLSLASKLEPNAPNPEMRIRALRELKDAGIPVILRLDPILPYLTEEEALNVLDRCDFVDHVVTSTLKLRADILKRIEKTFPNLARIYRSVYTERCGGYLYMPKALRWKILKRVVERCEELGISYAFCREGFDFEARSCDGSHLIR